MRHVPGNALLQVALVIVVPVVVGFVLVDRTSLAALSLLALAAWHLTLVGYGEVAVAGCGAAIVCRSLILAANPLGFGHKLFLVGVVLALLLAVTMRMSDKWSVRLDLASRVYLVVLVALAAFMAIHGSVFATTRSRDIALAWIGAVAVPSAALVLGRAREHAALFAMAVFATGASLLVITPLAASVPITYGPTWWTVAPIWVARAIALGSLAALCVLRGRIARFATFGVGVVALIQINQLGPLLGVVAGCAVMWLVGRSRSGSVSTGRLIVGLFAIFVAALTVGGSLGASLLGDYTSQSRLVLYRLAADQFQSAPWTGRGLGSFVAELPRERLFYPHNPFLEMFAATGVLGGILYVVAVLAGLWMVRRSRRWWPMVACALVFMQFSGGVQSNYEFFAVVGLAAAASKAPAGSRNFANVGEPKELVRG